MSHRPAGIREESAEYKWVETQESLTDIVNLRQLQPLFAPISSDISNMGPKTKEGFRTLGRTLFNETYRGAIVDRNFQLHSDDMDGNDCDAAHLTDGKLDNLRPTIHQG